MPPDPARYRLSGLSRDKQKVFFVRQEADGMFLFVTEDSAKSAAIFTKAEAIERCRRFRDGIWPCRIFNMAGQEVFEEESRPITITNGEDRRPSLFYIGFGHEADGLGYIVRPAVRPDIGKCYCVRAIDVPALAGREIESVFDKDPEQAVLKFLLICKQAGLDLANLPSRSPDLDQLEDVELRKIIQDIKASRKVPGTLRPGDR